MIPTHHYDKGKRDWTISQSVHHPHHYPSNQESQSSFPVYSQPKHHCPIHSVSPFGSLNRFDFLSSFSDEKNAFSSELYDDERSRFSTESSSQVDNARLLFENFVLSGYGADFDGLLSPPATISSTQTTLFGRNSAPPYETRYPPSPSSSVFSDRPRGLFDTNFNFNQFPNREYSSANGHYRKCEPMYTAEDVHSVVKNRRTGNEPRLVSNKVFVGGISHSTNRKNINTFFGQFGTVFVDWPVKHKNNGRGESVLSSYSYLFLVYSDEQSVINLMNACKNAGNDFFVSVPGCEELIQIRPWFIKNAFYIVPKAENTRCIDVHRTVFVGGLPRIVTAEEIAMLFEEFGKVLLVTIDIDQDYAYPKGAARVVFERDTAFNRALEKKFLKFENIDSSKTIVEIKPYVVEDVGCDQCGGLWFNPFIDVYDQLSSSIKDKKQQEDLLSKIDACHQKSEIPTEHNVCHEKENEENDVVAGAQKFLAMTKSFGLDKQKTVTIDGVEYPIGPALWSRFLPPPSFEVENDSVQMSTDQKVRSFLRMKRANVYSNKSSYCQDRPCRQYYCPSCSNKLHSGPNQHNLTPAGRPERRPRKDKDMYLVTPR
ncbi:CRE-FOG-1 protein [Caenorhabditis remanei]|uniref:FOG-1 n=1 Tax=Caenorhabditis remanei TaxID=31234 RepID=Q6E3E0_CAERE|nr:FOG-1 [Caenorhabditis remanei]AAT72438.1 FOG-1 [Caenorhabditis remanei]EFO95075.1 CRE-FOG-1 protein [Caenorhabditis remanei]